MKPYKKGDFIGQKYEVYGVLGEGGCGIVYLVYSHETKSTHALKTFRDEYLTDVTTRERFKKEAQVWIELERHPYLVRAYFVDEISGGLYIGMEHIVSDETGLNTLEGYLRRRPPDLAQTLRWAIQFCYGMEHAYSKGIKAHRDIKPANIMIGQGKAVKISDFGLAGVIGTSKSLSGIKKPQCTISGETYQTMEGSAFGTPPYMSPEQFENAAGCDERSDIYSFGVVLYQMASGGKLPFLPDMSESDERDVFQKWYMLHCKAFAPKLKSPLFPILFRCLEKKPINRYFSFKELRRDFETLLKKQIGEVVKLPELTELEAWELLNKGVSLDSLGKYQEAIACYYKALEINPGYGFAWNNKGNALGMLGKYQEAIACYDKALEINPGDGFAWHNKGVVLKSLGKHQEAIAYYDKALEINPRDAEAWLGKALSEDEIGRGQDAAFSYKRFIELAPTQYAEQVEYARTRLKELEGK
ncbi:MAG: protein kinase [Nitrospirae bacterium]|nr:MAG: protein kinase [Nitrospirota bacterium]